MLSKRSIGSAHTMDDDAQLEPHTNTNFINCDLSKWHSEAGRIPNRLG